MRAWRLGAFTILRALSRGLERAAHALAHAAAGVLTLDQLREAIGQSWQEFGMTEQFALSGLTREEEALYRRFLRPDDEILIVGSGSGRDLIALRRLGYRADGLEPGERAAAMSRAMLAKAGLTAEIHSGRIETVTLPRPFDVYIFSNYCYSYIPQRAARVAALAAAGERLKPGGRIVLSYAPCEGRPRPLRGLTAFVTRLTGAGWRPEATDGFGVVSGEGIHFEHRFMPGELEAEARAAGFKIMFESPGDESLAVLTREA